MICISDRGVLVYEFPDHVKPKLTEYFILSLHASFQKPFGEMNVLLDFNRMISYLEPEFLKKILIYRDGEA